VRSRSQTEARVGETPEPRNASAVNPNETRSAAQGAIDPVKSVNEPNRPDGFSARATTGAQARANAARDELEAAPARQNEPAPALDGYDDGGAPIGPSEEEEAAFLANESDDSSSHSQGVHLSGDVEVSAEDPENHSGPLPNLETLRAKISPEVLGLMEELFRAKLTRVTRVNKRDLKEAKSAH